MKNLLTLAVSICFASGLAFAEGEATTTHEPQAAAPEANNGHKAAPKKKPAAKKGHEKGEKHEEGATTPTTH